MNFQQDKLEKLEKIKLVIIHLANTFSFEDDRQMNIYYDVKYEIIFK